MIRYSRRRAIDIPVAIVLAVGTLASVLLAGYLYAREAREERQLFAQRADLRLAQVARGLSEALRGVHQANRLFAAVGLLDAQQVAALVEPLRRESPYVVSLASMDRLVDTAAAALPAPAPGALRIVVPQAASGTGSASAGAVTVAEIATRDMFAAIIASTGSGVRSRLTLAVYAGPAANPPQLVYRASTGAPSSACRVDCARLATARNLHWAGQMWHVTAEQEPEAFLALHTGAVALLLLGLGGTALAALYLRAQRTRTREVMQLVAQRTAELAALNQRLHADIEQRRSTAEELDRSRAELRELAEHNARVKEDERKRIAREIHDELGQSMLALKIDLTLMAAGYPAAASPEHLQQALAQIDTTIAAMRLIINELRPAVLDLGLDAAIEWECAKFSRRTGITFLLDLAELPPDTNDDVLTALYRIVQESLTNIMRHAQARQVRIALWSKDAGLHLRIGDDGIGMDPHCRRKAKSFGLIGISERIHALGGQFDTDSEAGVGTTLTICLPLRHSEPYPGTLAHHSAAA